MSNPTLIFDLDNTLIECGQFYRNAEEAFVNLIHTQTGLPKDYSSNILSALNYHGASLTDGFSRERLPRTYKAATYACYASAAIPIDEAVALEAERIADAVFEAEYPKYSYTDDVLRHYFRGGWALVLVSKGDEKVQLRKIQKNNLDRFFTPETTFIVGKKNAEILRRVVKARDIDVSNSWYIGDSLRDDVGPGNEVGFKTIEIHSKTGRWSYEDTNHVATHRVFDIADIVEYIPKHPRITTSTNLTLHCP